MADFDYYTDTRHLDTRRWEIEQGPGGDSDPGGSSYTFGYPAIGFSILHLAVLAKLKKRATDPEDIFPPTPLSPEPPASTDESAADGYPYPDDY